MIIIIPIAQCIGRRPFVGAVLGYDHMREVKEFIEESCECIGYMLLLPSSWEFLYWRQPTKK